MDFLHCRLSLRASLFLADGAVTMESSQPQDVDFSCDCSPMENHGRSRRGGDFCRRQPILNAGPKLRLFGGLEDATEKMKKTQQKRTLPPPPFTATPAKLDGGDERAIRKFDERSGTELFISNSFQFYSWPLLCVSTTALVRMFNEQMFIRVNMFQLSTLAPTSW